MSSLVTVSMKFGDKVYESEYNSIMPKDYKVSTSAAWFPDTVMYHFSQLIVQFLTLSTDAFQAIAISPLNANI